LLPPSIIPFLAEISIARALIFQDFKGFIPKYFRQKPRKIAKMRVFSDSLFWPENFDTLKAAICQRREARAERMQKYAGKTITGHGVRPLWRPAD
jgi:hypothetical protein